MPRALTAFFFGLLVVAGTGAQGLTTNAPRWVLSGPDEVSVGQPFTVKAEVQAPLGYYQDAGSPFLQWEPNFPAEVTARTSSPPAVRAGKASYTGTFTLYRTLVLPAGTAEGSQDLAFTVGWQICQPDGVCLLPAEQTQSLHLNVVSAGSGSGAMLTALLGAFLGGLLLNLMPCVFPVLALKALGLASSAGRTRSQRRREALAFAAGGFLSVTLLGGVTALLAAWGQRLDWGWPFQQPVFVGALAAAFGALSLPLLGLGKGWSPFSLTQPLRGGLLAKVGSGAFLMLAAAPCTAPLLGPALGFALTRPALEIPFFFMAIGLGLVLPLLVLQFFPDWGRHLPKPGRWLMVTERIAGFLLAATTVYLAWVFLTLTLEDTPVPPAGWVAFSPKGLEAAQARGPVLVDATAAWCATCQVNELAVLGRADVLALLDARGVVRLRADYTRPQPAIQAWLAGVGRAGLPVYALYRPGKPVYLFPELLTDDNFTRVLPGLLEP